MRALRDILESRQIPVYFCAVAAAVVAAMYGPDTAALEGLITPVLALMLYATFLQVPIARLGKVFGRGRFLGALLLANFVVIPLLVALVVQFLPRDPMLRLGVLLVLLTPCIDYVVTFSHLGRADSSQLLAATPILLVVQMLLLPAYLGILLGSEAAQLVEAGPFIHAFLWLILVPLALAGSTQAWAARSRVGRRASAALGLLPVPATAAVLFDVIAAVLPRIGPAADAAIRVVPVYIAFAVIAPVAGWSVARCFDLETPARRAVAFSSATRNSLVVLPLALAVPGAMPLLPAVIVMQTLVELASELVYVRIIGALPPK
ncbi:MAG: arsenic resistance protein [Burkholderiaceae bacterium]|nr:arsenic resistance protein [Burkholderiaceae bacterium]